MSGDPLDAGRITRLAQSIGAAREPSAIFAALARFISASVPSNGIFISLFDPERQERRCVYAQGEGREIDASTLPPLPLNDSPHSRAVSTGEVVITDNLQQALAGRHRVDLALDTDPRLPQSSIAVPMAVMGRVIGAVEVQSVEPAAYRPDDATLMHMAASIAAVAIENVRLLERERATHTASQISEQRHRALVTTLSQMVWTADARGRIKTDIPAWRALTGQTVDELLGWGWMNAIHPDDRAQTGHAWRRAIRTNSLYEAEYRVRTRNGAYRFFSARGAPVVGAESRVHEWFGVCIDIDEQKRKEELQEFLVEASRLLAGSLDYESMLDRVARLAVPVLADTCVIYLVEPEGEVRRVCMASVDPGKTGTLEEMSRLYPVETHEGHPVLTALRRGQPELITEVSEALLRSVSRDARQLELLRSMGPRSLMVVPLIARGRTLGAINLVIESSQRRYGPRQLLHAEELASRIALAVDNVRLYRAEQEARRRAERAADRTARLQAVTAALSEALTPAQVAEAIIQHGAAALEAAAGFVARLAPSGHALEFLFSVGYPSELFTRYEEVSLDAALPITDAIRTREPIWLASPEERGRRYENLAAPGTEYGYRAWAAIPMLVEGGCVGVVGLSFTQVREPTSEEIAFLLALGRQCGLALERARLYEESRDANRAKSDFLAVMSHELRTPLSAIIGYADLLADEIAGPVSEAQRVQLGRIKASSWHLVQLIEQILTFVRMEAGRQEVRFDRVDANEIAREAADMLEATLTSKGVALNLHLPDEPTQMQTDAGKVRQILLNLLSNGMKFTDQGEVCLSIWREEDDVVFTVSDTGIGIAPENLEHIFEPFRQLEHAMTRTVGGTGLGLSVTRRLAELLGGSVLVTSTLGEGSTFTVRLPVSGGAPALT